MMLFSAFTSYKLLRSFYNIIQKHSLCHFELCGQTYIYFVTGLGTISPQCACFFYKICIFTSKKNASSLSRNP